MPLRTRMCLCPGTAPNLWDRQSSDGNDIAQSCLSVHMLPNPSFSRSASLLPFSPSLSLSLCRCLCLSYCLSYYLALSQSLYLSRSHPLHPHSSILGPTVAPPLAACCCHRSTTSMRPHAPHPTRMAVVYAHAGWHLLACLRHPTAAQVRAHAYWAINRSHPYRQRLVGRTDTLKDRQPHSSPPSAYQLSSSGPWQL